ncbi:hypothetical protein Cni_G14716 [Canna indica]|uniref:Uncharacterized protein n=1 Tax=Canna indica TaxID=4628 RepID=A0AAQ3QF12_9LILI|nr:hypothetical protein Cni_G14716 [Canna indica]
MRIQTMSFSKEKKLQLMQSIADEFSVGWDSWAFEHRAPNSPAGKYEQPTEVESLQSANDASPSVTCLHPAAKKTRKATTDEIGNVEQHQANMLFLHLRTSMLFHTIIHQRFRKSKAKVQEVAEAVERLNVLRGKARRAVEEGGSYKCVLLMMKLNKFIFDELKVLIRGLIRRHPSSLR